MDSIDKIFYKDSKKKFKKYSNEKLIMKALCTLLDDINELKDLYIHFKDNPRTEALKDELYQRITGPRIKE